MVGVVLGLGFQWLVVLTEPWQYVAFIFVYLDVIDFWIDYGPSLKKWPPKREIDVFLDLAIVFSLFLYIYTVQVSLVYFIGSFILLRVLDFFWLLSSKIEYNPKNRDKLFLETWLRLDVLESFVSGLIILLVLFINLEPLTALIIFIVFRIITRVIASNKYKMAHFS